MRRAFAAVLLGRTTVFLFVLAPAAGCVPAQGGGMALDRASLKQRAMEFLKAGVTYRHNPVVRVEAVEALETCGREPALPWIRSALSDEHPAVRFAAAVALGRLADKPSEPVMRSLLSDTDASVQLAALFALHRLGDIAQSGRIPTYLLQWPDVTVRRNAALLLGLLNEPSAVKVLARAMRDADPGVRHHALEGMARLGNAEARQELAFMCNAGVGSEEVFAIGALAQTKDPVYVDTFRYKLTTAPHVETRLAAARALGDVGFQDGFETAIRALRINRALRQDADDPPADQILRIKQLAAAALGSIGKAQALPDLTRVMDTDGDPRIQVAAARSVLQILAAEQARALPFAAPGKQHGS